MCVVSMSIGGSKQTFCGNVDDGIHVKCSLQGTLDTYIVFVKVKITSHTLWWVPCLYSIHIADGTLKHTRMNRFDTCIVESITLCVMGHFWCLIIKQAWQRNMIYGYCCVKSMLEGVYHWTEIYCQIKCSMCIKNAQWIVS